MHGGVDQSNTLCAECYYTFDLNFTLHLVYWSALVKGTVVQVLMQKHIKPQIN